MLGGVELFQEMTRTNARSRRLRWILGGVVALVLPLALLWLLPSSPEALVRTSGVVGLVVAQVTLAAGLLVHVHGRLTQTPSVAWLAGALVAASVERAAVAGMRLGAPEEYTAHHAWMLVVDLVFTAVLLSMVTLSRDRVPPIDPLILGVGLGGLAGLLRMPIFTVDPVLTLSTHPAALTAGNLLLAALYISFAWAVLRLSWSRAWAWALPCAVLLLGVGRAASYPMLAASLPDRLSLVTNVAAAALISVVAVTLLHAALIADARTAASLHDRVEQAEQSIRQGSERQHEISATVAGITMATRLMHEHPDLEDESKHKLDEMLLAEIERLSRLVEGRVSGDTEIDLDRTIEHLVLAQRTMGRPVDWTPGGLSVVASRDHVAEVLTALLTNAAEHAPGAPVHVGTRISGRRVEIAVVDQGPGVSPEAADRIFEWGGRDLDSHGQGIGLAVARRITHHLGGTLFVLPSQVGHRRGAAFVVSLPLMNDPDPNAGPTCDPDLSPDLAPAHMAHHATDPAPAT